MRVIGLTGGIASGKSTVSAYLAAKGITVLDADQISRTLTGPQGQACAAIAEAFGAEYLSLDGGVDRKKLSARVFGDSQARDRLNKIIHPLVLQQMLQDLDRCRVQGKNVVVLDVPLLFESGMDRYCNAVWTVSAAQELRVMRGMARSGCTKEDMLARMSAQMTDEEREARASAVIRNDGTLEQLYSNVDILLQGVSDEKEKA